MEQSHEHMREVEPGVREMSEHSLPNMLHPPVVKVKIGKVSNQVLRQHRP